MQSLAVPVHQSLYRWRWLHHNNQVNSGVEMEHVDRTRKQNDSDERYIQTDKAYLCAASPFLSKLGWTQNK